MYLDLVSLKYQLSLLVQIFHYITDHYYITQKINCSFLVYMVVLPFKEPEYNVIRVCNGLASPTMMGS